MLFDPRAYYQLENEKIQSSYEQSISEITQLVTDMEDHSDNKYFIFLKAVGGMILRFTSLEKELSDEHFSEKTFTELYAENTSFYEELFPENYGQSYANPEYTVRVFGMEIGQLLSWFYVFYLQYSTYAFYHKLFKMEEYNQLFLKVYQEFKKQPLDFSVLKDVMTSVMRKDRSRDINHQYKESHDPEFRYITDLLEHADLSDERYLFRFGLYISENQIQTARFITRYPADKLKLLAASICDAYYKGFERDGKDVSPKSTIGLFGTVGLERLYREIILVFRTHPSTPLETTIQGYRSEQANEQYPYDHKFDQALFLSESYNDQRLKDYEIGLEENKAILNDYSGIMYIEKFGDPQFSPKAKEANLQLSKEQQLLVQQFRAKAVPIIDRYMPRSKTSFCIVGFPTPRIGDDFEKIFEDTLEINMLDASKYEIIQQKMIDVLDQATTVHVKGKGDNTTDLHVQMQPIKDPDTQTNFMNSGATVNIPCGEVFTSPQLKGTTGRLHVAETYQRGFRYDNLVIDFEDGYTTDFNCTNFESTDENKKYIKDNLFFPHDSLPLGEFAIGTNTIAYSMARKYNIMNLLPVLILEKTGPHFAIGDTCYAREENKAVINPQTNKIICAKDNEKSRLRETTPMDAYTNKHEDIVLPFDDIEFISAILGTGEKVDLIRDGRFVLAGTEELNIPLDDVR